MTQVENAIILAAGMGSRFVPITYEIPKGLIKVRGESLVERQIRQLLDKGISEIILVTGYLHTAFQGLEEKYKGIVKCVYNPEYESRNNISSLYLVRHYLKNTYLLSSDNYYTENIFKAEETESWYCAVSDSIPRQEWGLITDQNGRIIDIQKSATANQPFMYGAVYFNRQFSEKFRQILEREYQDPITHQCLWEEILKKHISELDIRLNRQSKEVIYELENFEELRDFDPAYAYSSGNQLLQLIAQVFAISEAEITQIMPQKMGMTNDSFLFAVKGKRYVFRLPGKGSEQFIDRRKEAFVYRQLKEMDITDQVIYFNEDNGIKISVYEEGSRIIRFTDKDQLHQAIKIMKQVHQSGIKVREQFGIETCKRYEEQNQGKPEFFADYYQNRQKIEQLCQFLSAQDIQSVFCHTDVVQENILCLTDGKVRLIDWEYAAMSEPMVDLASFVICGKYGEEELKEMAELYYERELTDLEWLRVYVGVALSALTWAAWTKNKEYQGYYFHERNYAQNIYAYVKPYLQKAEQWMEKYHEKNRD